MFTRTVKTLFLIYALSFSMLAFAGSETLSSKVEAFSKQYEVPGAAVIVYINGQPETYYYGVADKEKNIPVSKHTIFELGSVSKVMTNLILAAELDMAKLQLDTKVSSLVPELPETFSKITLQQLATHTSGLAFDVPAPSLKDWYLSNKTKEEWQYSNAGIALLGYAMEQGRHHRFDELYKILITDPLGMKAMGLIVPVRLQKQLARGHDQQNHPTDGVKINNWSAAYGVKASANDMQKFLAAAIGLPGTPERILYPVRMTQSAYIKLSDFSQGLGWNIYMLDEAHLPALANGELYLNPLEPQPVAEQPEQAIYDGSKLIEKTGMTKGFQAYIGIIPDKKSGIVILINKHLSREALAKLARGILFKRLGMYAESEPGSLAQMLGL